MPAPADRLDSWKEIAAYLNRGVRTVRRWEQEEALPVHRHVHRTLGSVYAFKSEIDAWRRSRPERTPGTAGGPRRGGDTREERVKSIAVLPFTDIASEPGHEYFADGLTEELIADLSKVRTLRVISRTSSMRLKHTRKDVKTISRELGVRYLLEGSVRRVGNRLRISAQLIDAATDDHLWSDKYDGTIDDVFAMQERLSRVIVDALAVRLTTDEDRRLSERPIPDVAAYECYLRARHEAWRWQKDAIDRAIHLLRHGLALVGENALLYATLGFAHLQYREAGVDCGEGPLQEAEACAEKVLALAPESAPGLQLHGWIHYSRGRIQDAVHDLKKALAIEAGNPDTLLLLINCYLISGRVSVARPLIDRILALDPLTPVSRCLPGYADALEGNLTAAVEPYRQMFEMDPGSPMARLFYVWVLALNRRTDSVTEIVKAIPPETRETVAGRLCAFLAHALAGNARAAAAAVTPQIEALATATDVFPRLLAQGYALLGLKEAAIHWIAIAVERGFINYPFLARHDPFLGSVRGDPRFETLMETVRDRWERFQA